MFSFLYCFSCILLIFRFYCVAEEAEGNKRFVSDDFKPAIFGSKKFNPVIQIFEDLNEPQNNGTVTEIGDNIPSEMFPAMPGQSTTSMFRKNVFNTLKPTQWWARVRTRPTTTNVTVPAPKLAPKLNHL